MSKKHSYLSRISKNRLFLLNLPNKYLWENIRFFHKNHELTPLKNFDFLGFFKTLHFWSKHILFSPQYQKTIFFSGLICPKLKKSMDLPLWKILILLTFLRLTPLKNFDFLAFLKTLLFWFKKHYFLSKTSKTISSGLICPKNNHEKIFDFCKKTIDKPLCKILTFWTFLKLHFSWPKIILFYPKY